MSTSSMAPNSSRTVDQEDYDDEADYYAHAANWMGNWGEAVNMWALDGIFADHLGEVRKVVLNWPIHFALPSHFSRCGGCARLDPVTRDSILEKTVHVWYDNDEGSPTDCGLHECWCIGFCAGIHDDTDLLIGQSGRSAAAKQKSPGNLCAGMI